MERNDIHKGHRERLKRKFINKNGEDFESHELLELLLFYALPQKNTNEIAHRLLLHFGSLAGVLEADINDITAIDGIKEHSAILLKIQLAMLRAYMQEKYELKNRVLTKETMPSYIKSLFFGRKDEAMFAVMLDGEGRIITTVKLSEGTKHKTPLYTRELIKKAIEANADSVILVHNHPSGNSQPSESDLKTTKIAEEALSYVNVRLLEHIIVAGENQTAIKEYLQKPKYIQKCEV